ncbi:MAG: DUF5693 family protein, partial [Defluviitaleaceae bacterium]|nr:DUF5693 family protein [Defluviitaleaceae bacterium]
TFVPYLRPLNTSTPRTLNRIAIGLSLAVAGGLYLTYLFKLKAAHTLIITGIAAALAFGMNLVTGLLPLEISLIYALGAALIYPTFSSLLMLLYLRNYKHHIFVLKLVFVLGILFAVNGLAMYTIVSSMADIRFIMNIITYRGVQLSLIVPLAMFGFNYLIVFNDEDNIIQTVRKFLMKSPNYLILGLGVVGMGFLYIHLARSGHTTAITPSTLELRMREILEALFVARPRFREIIFGYPALAVMIYLYHKYKQNLILLGLGFGVMLGVTSMVNSFCHGFTSIYISMHRTLGGLILGGLIASGVLIGVIIAEKLLIFAYKKYYLPSVKDSVKDKEVGECL